MSSLAELGKKPRMSLSDVRARATKRASGFGFSFWVQGFGLPVSDFFQVQGLGESVEDVSGSGSRAVGCRSFFRFRVCPKAQVP